MSDLLNKAKDCAVYLGLVLPVTGAHCGLTNDDRLDCRGENPGELTEEQTRACITFLLRQMRNSYAPYPCLTSGELLGYLNRWIELKEEAE